MGWTYDDGYVPDGRSRGGRSRNFWLTAADVLSNEDCPFCSVPAGERCKWPVSGENHYDRMLVGYGWPPSMALEIAARHRRRERDRAKGGSKETVKVNFRVPAKDRFTESELAEVERRAVMLVTCPYHKAPRHTPCARGGACPVRQRILAQSVRDRWLNAARVREGF